MQQLEKLLENPVMQIVAATSLLLVALRGVIGVLFGLVNLVGILENTFFDRLWNLAQGEWLAIFIVIGAWVALGSMLKLDAALMGASAGAFVFLAVVMANVRRDLPEVLDDLYALVPPVLFLVAAATGLVTLLKSAPSGFEVSSLYGKATSNLGLGGGAPEPTGMPTQAPPPSAAPTQVQAPLASPEAGWLPDPQGEAQLRYWDGSAWTEHTHNG